MLLLTILCVDWSKAQYVEIPDDSVSIGFLPALSYASDFGFIGGGVFSRIDFRGNHHPFKNQLVTSALLSTKGYGQVSILYDKTQNFGTDYRVAYELALLRLAENNFFGIGNKTPFDKTLWIDGDYFYASQGVLFNYRGRYPISKNSSNGKERLDVLLLGNVTYERAKVIHSSSKLNLLSPMGLGDAQQISLGTGFYRENRDNEIIPKFGSWTELNILSTLPKMSSQNNVQFMFRHHQYVTVHFVRDLTLAARFYWRHIAGNAPFWNLSDAGFDDALRGYPFRRFLDKGAVTGNLELRTWLWDFPSVNIRIGGYFFTDVGRVFADFSDYQNLLNDLHQTYGLGGTLSLFNPNFFVRGELGFSDETSRFYVGFGYLF